MKVFISWSGERSKYVAESLRNWLPKVIQAVDPWMSQEDIASGGRWSVEVASELEASKFGILCITPENESNPWIMFEAGALSKTLNQTFLCPYLYQMAPSQLSSPLSQFQAQITSKDGTLRILKSINLALGANSIGDSQLDEIFEVWWPKLDSLLQAAPEYDDSHIVKRTSDQLLEEIVDNTREQLRREEIRLQRNDAFEEKFSKLTSLMESFYQTTQVTLDSGKAEDILKGLIASQQEMPAHLKNMLSSIGDITSMDEHFKSLVLNPPKDN